MEGYIGTIIAWAPNYAPQYWLFCDGSVLNIKQYQALYSLLGTRYGGDGINTFGLPNLNGRVPVGATPSTLGQTGGADSVKLSSDNMPTIEGIFKLNIPTTTLNGNKNNPQGQLRLAKALDSNGGAADIYTDEQANANLELSNILVSGTASPNNPIDIRQPYLALNYIICVDGLYPPRP